MAEQVINNGSFDNDGSAEKIRLAFQKVKEMFAEIYTQIPFEDADIATKAGQFLKVNAGETALEWAAVPGGGDLLSTNNLNDVASASQARTNLGLGSAATTAISAYATAAQGAKADTALQSAVAGAGISINIADPINPIITNTNLSNNVQSASFAPATGILTLTLETGTVTVNLSAYTVLKIDGYEVKKGAGINYAAIEVGDFCHGWDGTSFVAFRVDALPYTTAGNVTYAVNGGMI